MRGLLVYDSWDALSRTHSRTVRTTRGVTGLTWDGTYETIPSLVVHGLSKRQRECLTTKEVKDRKSNLTVETRGYKIKIKEDYKSWRLKHMEILESRGLRTGTSLYPFTPKTPGHLSGSRHYDPPTPKLSAETRHRSLLEDRKDSRSQSSRYFTLGIT